MTQRFRLELPTPATGFMDSLLIGNGRLGATLAGRIGEERVDINLDRFWSGGPEGKPQGPSPAHLLPKLRAAIAAGDSARADALSRQMQGKGWTQSYQPVAALRFAYGADGGEVEGYERHLDLSRAIAQHSYSSGETSVRLRSLVSTSADVVAMIADGAGLLPDGQMRIGWDCQHPHESRDWEADGVRWSLVTGRAPATVIPPYVEDPDPIRYGNDRPDVDGTVAAGMGFAALAAMTRLADGRVLVLVAAECGFRGAFARPSVDVAGLARIAEARLRAALAVPVEELEERHVADHRTWFDRVDFELPSRPGVGVDDPARAELLYHFGRYLLIASSRPGTEPANLQGIWNPYRRPAWSSNHTTNINAQMNYWPSEPSALGDLARAQVDMTADLVAAGRETARHFYGAPGSVTHHNTDLWRFTRPVEGDPNWANWTAALPWLLAHAWDHWDYASAGDDFARDQLLPMLAEVARFLLFMLVENEAGQLVVSPSSSPENCFVGPDGQGWGVDRGSAMDQELCRQVFERMVILSERFGSEAETAAAAATALPRLRLPDADGSGALQEWARHLTDAEPGHRHLSHLYGLYPGDRLHPRRDVEGAEMARAALESRLAHGTGHTGWSQSWVLCFAARLGLGALCTDAVATLLTKLTTRALLVLHPYDNADGAVFQIDGNFGATAGIGEMLVQSLPGLVLLLPSLPESWDEGMFRGVKARGGHTLEARWQGGVLSEARLMAGRAERLVIDVPCPDGRAVVLVDANGVEHFGEPSEGHPGRAQLFVEAVPGAAYCIILR